jgi:(p)ppGpp synthase/HD superfamily hydrolase
MRNMKMIHKACLFATQAHGTQQYGREPYFVHLQAVADMVIRLGGDDEAEQVAWLHDVIEDTPTSLDTLVGEFSGKVVVAVQALTKRDGVAYEDYIEGVRNNPLALLVKKADTLCNLIQSTLQGNRKRVMKYTLQLQLLTAE